MPSSRRTALLAGLVLAATAVFGLGAPGVLAQAPASPIGSWRAAAVGAAPLPATPRADITFTAEGRAHGSSGCNRFMGGFTLDGAALRFDTIAGTRMACEAPAMELEQRFLDALAAVRGWRREGPSLLLTDGAGATVLRLLPAEAG
jgi:putative lipoprotein